MMSTMMGTAMYQMDRIRSNAVSPQAADVVDSALNSALSTKSQSLAENISQSLGEKISQSHSETVNNSYSLQSNELTNQHDVSNCEELRLNKSAHDDYLEPSRNASDKNYFEKYTNSDNINSSDIESDQDKDELIPDSPRDGGFTENRLGSFSQRLPSTLPTSVTTSNPSHLFGSSFSAEEARLRLSLDSSHFKERFPQFHSPPYGSSDPHRRFSLQEHRPELESNGSNHSTSPDSKNLTESQLGSFQGQGPPRRFEEKDSALIPRIKEGLYFCHLCSFSGTTQQDFDLHMTCHFEHVCPHCDYKSRTEGRLKRHIKDFHTEDPEGGFGSRAMPGRPKIFRCKQCEFSTTDKVEFWTHSRSHIKEDKLLQCPRCPFVTEYKHHLEYHLRNHFGSKPFKCPKCNYACVNKSMLNSHMKSHTNVYQYRCADCTYATKYCHSLKLHLRKYNHKPAAVLNSDGSLPQGVDATSSGLSLLAKRGPPRGPRGPRKDKLEPRMGSNFLQMPASPMGPIPGLPGMMPPFWPMLHGGLQNGMPSPLGLGPRFNPNLPALPPPPPPPPVGIKSEEMKSPGSAGSSNPYKCNFCSFIGTNREVLTSHIMKVHASENHDLFSIFGISSETLLGDSRKRMCGADLLKSPMKSPRMGIFDSPHAIKKERPDDFASASQEKVKSSKDTLMPYPFMNDRFPSSGGVAKDEGIDILKQMTLKFGSGPAPSEVQPKLTPTSSAGDSPLDLTKPRSSSPVMPLEPFSDCKREMKPDEGEQSSGENSVYSNEMTSPTPRKRSRKGRAFKLDTLCMKLQERQAGMYGSDEESMDEMYSSDILPVDTDMSSPIGVYDSVNTEHGLEKSEVEAHSKGEMEENDGVRTIRAEGKQDSSGSDGGDGKVGKEIRMYEEEGKDKDITDDFHKIHTNLEILNEMKSKDSQNNNERIEELEDNSNNSMEEPVSTTDCELEMGDGRMTSFMSEETKSQDNQLVPASHNRRKPVPAAIQRGADIAWKILNDPSTDAKQFIKNGNKGDNGHSNNVELSTLDKKLWFEAPDCNDGQKGDFECPHCQISFGDCIMYTMHMGYHGFKDPYKCNMCGDTCKDRVEFFLHIARAAHN